MPINLSEILLIASFWLIFMSILASLVHLYQGPLILDRVNALNLLGNLSVALLIVLAYYFKDELLLEAALLFNLVSFIAIVAMTDYLLKRMKP